MTPEELLTLVAERAALGNLQDEDDPNSGDLDEIGKSLSGLLGSVRQYDPNAAGTGGFLGFFKRKLSDVKAKFDTVDDTVNRMMAEVDSKIAGFTGRIGDLEQLFEDNKARYEALDRICLEAERRVSEMEANPPQVVPGDSFSAQEASDHSSIVLAARKRIDDLRRIQQLCVNQAPMIRLMADNSAGLVSKFKVIRSTTIPLMQQQFALYIINQEAEKGAGFATTIDDMTNQAAIKNAEMLGRATISINRSLNRSAVDFETLKRISEETLNAIDEVDKLRTAMKDRLRDEGPKLQALQQDIVARITRSEPLKRLQ